MNDVNYDVYRSEDIYSYVSKKINIYYYNNNLIRSAGSRQFDRHGSPDQTRHAVSSYCYNDKLMNNIYPLNFIENL